MKRIYLLIFAFVACVSTSYAQRLSDTWWSVNAGVNFSNLYSPGYATDYLTGFSVGSTYSRSVSPTIPIYIESGLYFQKRGARDNGFLIDGGESSKLTKYEFEIPLLLGYAAPVSGPWAVHPFVGLYYSVAVDGKFELGDQEFDPYSKELLQTLRDVEPTAQQLLHRSDFGVRVGMSVHYNRLLLGFAFDAGFTNLYAPSLRDQGYEAQSGCFTLQTGYVF
ncbi:MAG: outer membrane beta-barrel protein [Rikenellaceae bacterium]